MCLMSFEQTKACGGLRAVTIWKERVPSCTPKLVYPFKCGKCKEPIIPENPDPLVCQLMELSPILICPLCDKRYPQNKINEHVLRCGNHLFHCGNCKMEMQKRMIAPHVNDDCCMISCEQKSCLFVSNKKIAQIHARLHEINRKNFWTLPKFVRKVKSNMDKILAQNETDSVEIQLERCASQTEFCTQILKNLKTLVEKTDQILNTKK